MTADLNDPIGLIGALRAGVSGRVSAAGPETGCFARDFGGAEERRPAVVVHAGCEEDVAHTLRTARAARVPVRVRGAGHSCGGQSLCAGGIVLVNQSSGADFRLLEEGRVEVAGRSSWNALEAGLAAAGRAPPVLTDYLDLTVGGTLSVGGYGVRSIVHGSQVGQVDRLRLVLPDGTAQWCSADEDARLFRHALCGLGRFGVIERVVMRTVPHRRRCRLLRFGHDSLDELGGSLEWTQDPGAVENDGLCFDAAWMRGAVVSEFGSYCDDGAAPRVPAGRRRPVDLLVPEHPAQVHASRAGWLAQHRAHRALWSDWFFDYAGLRAYLRFIEPLLKTGLLARHLGAIYFLISRRGAAACGIGIDIPGAPDAGIAGEMAYGVGLYHLVPAGDEEGLGQVRRARRLCVERGLELGGRPYRYGCDELSDATCSRLYGRDRDEARALSRTLDPEGLLSGPPPAPPSA